MSAEADAARWNSRHGLATALRVAIFAAPVAAAVLAGWLVLRALPLPSTLTGRVAVVLAVVVASMLAMVAVDRLGRRLLPLSTLLDLTLLFPDRAPSRMKVARDAVRRRSVEEHLARLDSAGRDPQQAAREILVLVAALDRHDRPTRGHAERVRLIADLVAEEMGVSKRDRDRLRWASLLHDIGKLTVSAALLNKPGRPTEEEWEQLRTHPAAGASLAAPLMPWLGEWGDVIAQHHERYDGTGYPHGLRGSEISFGGRLVAVADAFEVMTAARVYRRPVSRAAAYRELVRCSGAQFDPAVVRAMVSVSAPKLRRVQGVTSLLSDVPLIASQTVPAATLARAVGSAALVVAGSTGVVGGGGLLAPHPAPAPAPQSASQPADVPGGALGASHGDRPVPTASFWADADHEPTADAPADEPGTDGGGVLDDPDVAPLLPLPVPSPSESPISDPVVGTVDGVVGTVDGVVGDVSGALDETVTGVTGAVDDTVGGLTGVVGGVVDGVLEETSTPSDPDPETAPEPDTGLLGGVLGSLGL